MITKEEIINFEKEIVHLFSQGKIKAPVHLRSGREDQLINIFKEYNIDEKDWIFGYWDSHELALLKGVPKKELRDSILRGNSIALSFPKYNLLCSGIVGSLMGVAVGVAGSLKRKKCKGRVFHFCGDMSAETGIFHESVKYAHNWNLPVKFIVCDNGLSVMTDTREVWNEKEPWFLHTVYYSGTMKSGPKGSIIDYFKYENKYPHSGLGKLIKF